MDPGHWLLLALIPVAYLAGSIPFGLIVGLWRGVDPRKAGSGNIGATNVGRLLGGKYFALVFTLDLLKGLLPMLAASFIVHHLTNGKNDAAVGAHTYLLWLLIGFATIAGHMFSLFLRFKGGKGVATSAGMVLGLFPFYTFPGLIAILTWLILFFAQRYVSLASLGAAAIFPIAYVVIGRITGWPIFGPQWPLAAFAVIIPAMIILKHRTNISRLLAGTEHGFARRASDEKAKEPHT